MSLSKRTTPRADAADEKKGASTTQSANSQSKIFQCFSSNAFQSALLPFLSTESISLLLQTHAIFHPGTFWQKRNQSDFGFIPDARFAGHVYHSASIHNGTRRPPLGYFNAGRLRLLTSNHRKQLSAIGINHSFYAHLGYVEIRLFLKTCGDSFNSHTPNFKHINGLLVLIQFHLDNLSGKEKKEIKEKILRLLDLIITKCTQATILGDAHFAIHLLTKTREHLQTAIKLNCARAIFHQAQTIYVNAEEKLTDDQLETYIKLIEQAANLNFPPACFLVGAGMLHLNHPELIKTYVTHGALNKDQIIFESISFSEVTLRALIKTITRYYKNKSQPTNETSSSYLTQVMHYIPSLLPIIAKPSESKDEIQAIQFFTTAVEQSSTIVLPALIAYHAKKQNAAMAIKFLLKYSGNDSPEKWHAFGLAFRDGGNLDLLRTFRYACLPDKGIMIFPSAKIKGNITPNPELALFCLKNLFRSIVNLKEQDEENAMPNDQLIQYALLLPLTLTYGAGCIPQDTKHAEELLEIALEWAKRQGRSKLHRKVYNLLNEIRGNLEEEFIDSDDETEYQLIAACRNAGRRLS